MVEQLICNQQVGGSSPLASSSGSRGQAGVGCWHAPRSKSGSVKVKQTSSAQIQSRHSRPDRADGARGRGGPVVIHHITTSAGLGGSDRGSAEASAADAKNSLERYRSGQTGQAVNLLAQAYGGSNPPLSTRLRRLRTLSALDTPRTGRGFHAGIAQLARAQAFQAWGRGFEPRFPLQQVATNQLFEVVESHISPPT
jgi:hypothetical protein